MLKCFILKGNYHVGLEGLSAELALAANRGCSHVTTITAELLVKAKAMLKRVDNWRPELEGKERSLLHAVHSRALLLLSFKELRAATTGPAAVPAIVDELLGKQGGAAA